MGNGFVVSTTRGKQRKIYSCNLWSNFHDDLWQFSRRFSGGKRVQRSGRTGEKYACIRSRSAPVLVWRRSRQHALTRPSNSTIVITFSTRYKYLCFIFFSFLISHYSQVTFDLCRSSTRSKFVANLSSLRGDGDDGETRGARIFRGVFVNFENF